MRVLLALPLLLVLLGCWLASTTDAEPEAHRGIFRSGGRRGRFGLFQRKLRPFLLGSCQTESGCASRFRPARCCERSITTSADGGSVTFDRFGRCVGLAKVQAMADIQLDRIDDDLAASANVAGTLTSLSAGRDALLICPAGSLDAATGAERKKRQTIRPQIGAEALTDSVIGPVVLTADMVEVTTAPPITTPPTTGRPGPTGPPATAPPTTGRPGPTAPPATAPPATAPPATAPPATAPPATAPPAPTPNPPPTPATIDVRGGKRSPFGLFKSQAEKAESLLSDLVNELDELKG